MEVTLARTLTPVKRDAMLQAVIDAMLVDPGLVGVSLVVKCGEVTAIGPNRTPAIERLEKTLQGIANQQ